MINYVGTETGDSATEATAAMTEASTVQNPLTANAPIPEAEYFIPNPTLPPVSCFWVRIKSSKPIAFKALKPYYFVLDKGRLTMFKDSLKTPPYGIRPKGTIYLADHFSEASTIPGEVSVALLHHGYPNQALVSAKKSNGGMSPRLFAKESFRQLKSKKEVAKVSQKSCFCFGGSSGGGGNFGGGGDKDWWQKRV